MSDYNNQFPIAPFVSSESTGAIEDAFHIRIKQSTPSSKSVPSKSRGIFEEVLQV